jgi:hypothetical protein
LQAVEKVISWSNGYLQHPAQISQAWERDEKVFFMGRLFSTYLLDAALRRKRAGG